MAWYGFFAVSSLYITGAVGDGGLGFSDEDRGVLQGVVTFFLYLFPVVTGALADRYGYKRMPFAAFGARAGLTCCSASSRPSHVLPGLPPGGPGCRHVQTRGDRYHLRVTNDRTASMGFGIFCMMVNIGGFVGPIVAGIVRGWDWSYVFIASAIWISVNFIILAFFSSEPTRRASLPTRAA